jgi:streptomycin 6-kinase
MSVLHPGRYDRPNRPDLTQLVPVAEELAREWGVELGPPFAMACWSYVAPAGEDAVLKVMLPDEVESLHDGDALALWDGEGAVRVLRQDPERLALLMERLRPGTDISGLPEEEATAIAISVGRKLWRPAGEPFRPVEEHVRGELDRAEREGRELVPLARELFAALAPIGRETLVHGDFHHHNILDAGGGRYVAIDSKAMLGEPEFDVPAFLWNPLDTEFTLERTLPRIAAFAAAGLDEARIRAWTVIRGAYQGISELDVLRALV